MQYLNNSYHYWIRSKIIKMNSLRILNRVTHVHVALVKAETCSQYFQDIIVNKRTRKTPVKLNWLIFLRNLINQQKMIKRTKMTNMKKEMWNGKVRRFAILKIQRRRVWNLKTNRKKAIELTFIAYQIII